MVCILRVKKINKWFLSITGFVQSSSWDILYIEEYILPTTETKQGAMRASLIYSLSFRQAVATCIAYISLKIITTSPK